ADGSRHEQIRPGARLHRPSVDVERNLGPGLCRRVAALLHGRTCRDDHSPRARVRHQPHQGSRLAYHLFRRGAHRERSSAAIRLFAPQVTKARRYGMPVVHPFVFYPWRLADFIKVTSRWLRLIWRYRRIMAKVVSDPAARSCFDEALRPHSSPGETDHFVEVFADKIPHTHGAP